MLYVLLLNVSLQGVESYLVTPLVQRMEETLPPALTILLQLLVGVVVGAPLAVVVMVLTQMLYIRGKLGDSESGRLVERLSDDDR